MATSDDKLRIKRNLINRQRKLCLTDRQLSHLVDILDGKVEVAEQCETIISWKEVAGV